MSKLQLVLLALFILGLVGAVNSITNQSTIDKEKGFLKGVLSLMGLTYKPEPEPAREFDFVPGRVTSEVSKLTPENLKATPSAKPSQTAPSTAFAPQQNTPSPAPSTSTKYNFTFSNEVPIPPIAPNQQTLGVRDQNTVPIPPESPSSIANDQKPPIPPVSTNQASSKINKPVDIIDTILKLLSID